MKNQMNSLSHLKITINSLTSEIGSQGYHVYRQTTLRNITLHQQVKVLKETSSISIDTNPYCCKIIIKRVDRIGDITLDHIPRELSTLDHIPRELSRFVFYFIHEEGSVTETATDITPRTSPIPEGGLEIPILIHFVHKNNAILNKMKTFVIKKYIKYMKNSSLIRW